MNFRLALSLIVVLYSLATILTSKPVILSQKQQSCLAPILSDISDRNKRIKQVEKLFTRDVVNDVLLRGITRRMKAPLPDTLTTYAKPQRSRNKKLHAKPG